jgi:alpha-1,2-mannosyltransferase
MRLSRAQIQAAAFAVGVVGVVFLAAIRLYPSGPVDLRVYLAGAKALLAGTDVTAAHPPGSTLLFTYPPFAALLFVPLLAVPPATASLLLTAASLGALVVATRVSLRAIRPQWTPAAVWAATAAVGALALALDPVWGTLELGQVNLLLLGLILTDALAPEDARYRGALIGLAAGIKLTPAIFVPYLLITRQFRAARNAVAVALATVAVGLLAAPASTVRFWTGLVFDPNHVGGIPYAGNQSLYAVATRLGRGQEALRPLWMLAALTVFAVGLTCAYRLHQRGNRLGAVSVVGLTSLLVSPVSWNHHWVGLVPGGIAVWAVRWWLPAGVVALFAAQPIWWVPRTGNVEYDERGWQLLAGNAYVIAGVLVLATVAYCVHRGAALPVAAIGAPVGDTARARSVSLPRLRLVQGGEQRLGQVRREVVADEQLILGLLRPPEADGGRP